MMRSVASIPSRRALKPQAAERLELVRRMHFLRSVAKIRHKIRRFLAWQESSTGGWRFFGQGSGLPPDLDLTACAATVFVDPSPLPLNPSTYRRIRDLEQFRTADATFHTPGSRDEIQTDPALLWMANCNVLRYLALTGGEITELEAAILNALRSVASPPGDAPASCLCRGPGVASRAVGFPFHSYLVSSAACDRSAERFQGPFERCTYRADPARTRRSRGGIRRSG